LRRSSVLAASAAGILILIVSQFGCGGGDSSNTPTSGIDERVFVAFQNTSSGIIQIINAEKDQLTSSTISLGGSIGLLPQILLPGANGTTLVFSSVDNNINIIDTLKEAQVQKVGSIDCTASTTTCVVNLPGPTESFAETSDGKFIYAAVRSSSAVTVADLTGSSIATKNIPAVPGNCQTTNTCLPGAHRLVLSHNNAKVLVFNEDLNQFEIINTSDNSVATISGPGLDHPAYGVFSTDDSKAYILNCGAECGGTQASVVVFDMSALSLGTPVKVDAATIGISDTSNLYVGGSNPATPGGGSLTVLPLSSLTGGKQIKIGDGFHQVISLFQNRVIVGARTCTTGCLSIVDANGGTALIDTPGAGQAQKGDVTAITPVTPRKVFYAAEGGEVRIYDATTGQEELTNNTPIIDISGRVNSVLYAGPKT